MKLSEYAKKNSISYRTAWNHFKDGKIKGARQLETGTIVVEDEARSDNKESVATYSRVSSSENKQNLQSQKDRLSAFCSAKGMIVSKEICEIGSGLNDNRKKLTNLLTDRSINVIVVEHKDRLTRFGFNYIKNLYHGRVIVINEAQDDDDLIQDFISVITSFCARIYGRRRSKRKTEKLIEELNND